MTEYSSYYVRGMVQSCPSSGGLVLLVDDELPNRRTMRRVLESAGFRVVEAGGGEEALEQLTLNTVDVVLLDVLMPGIDGFETCRRIRRQRALGHVGRVRASR